MLNKLNELAVLLDKEYKTIEGRITRKIHVLNNAVYTAIYKYCYKDLNLVEHHPWKFSYNMDEDTSGRYETNGMYIEINQCNMSPVDYLFAALDSDSEEDKENYYRGACYCMSVMAHELRHAYQHEHELISDNMDYVNPEDNYNEYRQQWCEVDAREYQQRIITNELISYIIDNL